MLLINPSINIHSFIHLGNINWKSTMSHLIFCFSLWDSLQNPFFFFQFLNVSWLWIYSIHIQPQKISSLNPIHSSLICNFLIKTLSLTFLNNLLEIIFYTRLNYFLSIHWHTGSSHTEIAHPKVINNHHVDDKLDTFQTLHYWTYWPLFESFINVLLP